MTKRDLVLSFMAAVGAAVFLLPTLFNTGLYDKYPNILFLLFGAWPLVIVTGMIFAYFVGRKLAILWQFAKFALVGVLNTAIDFGILNFLILITGITSGLGIIFINAASFSMALVNSYFWNRGWVFAANRGSFLTFIAVTLVGLSINTGIVYGLTTYVPPVLVDSKTLWANLAKVLATILSLIWNFAGYRLIVFKR